MIGKLKGTYFSLGAVVRLMYTHQSIVHVSAIFALRCQTLLRRGCF